MLAALSLGIALSQEPGGSWTEMAHWRGLASDDNSLFGMGLCGPGDLDADGIPDICVGAPRTYYASRGKVFVYSGKTFELIRTITGNNFDELGYALSAVGDVDLDGTPDFLASGREGPSYGDEFVRILSGATGATIREVTEPAGGYFNAASDFGLGLGPLGDVDLDGVPDFYVTNHRWSSTAWTDRGALYAFSGATGTLLYSVLGPDGMSPDPEFGISAEPIGDLDGDGFPDLLVASREGAGGTIHAISGDSGGEIYRIGNRGPSSWFGNNLAALADLDGDQVPDFATTADAPFPGAILTFSGATGGLIGARDWLPDSLGLNLMETIGDADGDGAPDFVVWDYQGPIAGTSERVTLVSGASGAVLRTVVSAQPYSGFGYTLAGAGDLNADGRAEFVVGAYWEENSSGLEVGGAHVYGLEPFLIADGRILSASSGGQVQFLLDFPQSEAGIAYRLLASTDQAGPPWVTVKGVEMPLVPSAMLWRTWHHPPQEFYQSRGILNGDGNRMAILTLAPGAASAQVGRSFRLAAVTLPGGGVPGMSSAAVTLTIAP